jgi:hypothetical protein
MGSIFKPPKIKEPKVMEEVREQVTGEEDDLEKRRRNPRGLAQLIHTSRRGRPTLFGGGGGLSDRLGV